MADFSISDLAKLLNPTEDKSQTNCKGVQYAANPGNVTSLVNVPNRKENTPNSSVELSSRKDVDHHPHSDGSIWDDSEIEHDAVDFGDDDKERTNPDYEMLYKQSLTSDDVFLGLGRKDPSTACCECLLVKVSLPGIDDLNEITLDVKPTTLKCTTRKFYLGLHLPQKVESINGKASWDSIMQKLTIELPIEREFDCISLS